MEQQQILRDQAVDPDAGERLEPSIRTQARMPRSKRPRRSAPKAPPHLGTDVEADERTTRQSARNGMLTMVVAMAVLLVFNSGGLRTWVRDLPGNAVTDQLVVVSSQWHEIMRRVGVATPKAVVQEAIADLRGQSWRETLAVPAAKPETSSVN